MEWSRLRSRRGVMALALVSALARVVPVRAQWTNGCEYGITNGLVTIGGADCRVGVPQHMVDATDNAFDDDEVFVGSFTDTRKADRQARLRNRRDRRRRQRGRRTDRKRESQDRRVARRILCSDFDTQLEAVEAMSHFPRKAWRLDPDGDGIPCEELTPLTCKALGTEAEATTWFRKMGYSPEHDPFKLYDAETGGVCTKRATCDDFRTQKEAVEWLTDHPKDRARLDPDGDGMACAKLPTVTCKAFNTIEEARAWFNANGFTSAKDPYKLYDSTSMAVCPELACARFTSQKAAIDWLTDHPEYQKVLDPNNDGLACTHLTTVRCNQFVSSEEVAKWHERNSITDDPYGLWDDYANPKRYCSSLPLTTGG